MRHFYLFILTLIYTIRSLLMFFKKFTDVLFTEEVKSGKEQSSLKDGKQEGEWVTFPYSY